MLLTTLANPSTPRGFSCLFGGQRAAAVQGQSPLTDRHYELPIGSAGVLVGETADRYPVYMPFDDVDVSINLGDARLFTQFVIRSAAAGAICVASLAAGAIIVASAAAGAICVAEPAGNPGSSTVCAAPRAIA